MALSVSPARLGSPPHMRGKVSGGYTHANQTQDHPRTCGEKVLTEKELDYCKGSPPHMRGKEVIGGIN